MDLIVILGLFAGEDGIQGHLISLIHDWSLAAHHFTDVEMLDARNILLHFMDKAGTWPRAHMESVAAFFFNLEVHPRKLQKNSKRALIVYQARARREWFDALQRKQGFNIALIQEELLRSYADEVNESVHDRDFEQVRLFSAIPSPRNVN